MPSPLYQQFQPRNNLMQMMGQFRQTPMAMLSQRFNIPQNMSSPEAILQHLLDTRQVSQEQVNRAMQMKNDLFRQ